MKAYRTISDLPLQRRLKGLTGRAIVPCFPKLAREILENPFGGNPGPLGRLIRNGYYLRAVAKRDFDLTQRFLMNYWESPASEGFFDEFEHRFESLFLKYHAGIVDALQQISRSWSVPAPRIVEIGVGDGRVLEYLASRLTNFAGFHGIDVNKEQIAKNQVRYADHPKFTFSTDDALDWLARNPALGTVIYTNGGVFEYLTRDQLLALFTELARSSQPCAVAVTETIASDHDLEAEPESFHYGREFSISHNYPAILKEAGFQVCYQNDRPTKEGEEGHPQRWLQVVGTLQSDETGLHP